VRDWFAKGPRWHIHFAPTTASWINQVERVCALLTDRTLRDGVFRSLVELETASQTPRKYNKAPTAPSGKQRPNWRFRSRYSIVKWPYKTP